MDIRNIAIIAHVDHGKTTLVDWMLKETHTFRENEAEMFQQTILDSNELEREKGITILAKNTSVTYSGTKINIIDTPGHADFSGEVERVLNMADGALLIIDAAEGPLPQTHFVLKKALETGLKLIVLINKIDRQDARPGLVLHETEELFLRLATDELQLVFPVLYGVGREGKVWHDLPDNPNKPSTLVPLFETILETVPLPSGEADKPFKMLVTTLDHDPHRGTIAVGRVTDGTISPGQQVLVMEERRQKGSFRVDRVYTHTGLKRTPVAHGETGDIIAVTGGDVAIGQTLADPADPVGFAMIAVEEPTLKLVLAPNTSPFAGREGKFGTARQLSQRLIREKRTNIGLKIEENEGGSSFVVSGRGELHLAVLLETLRREGYEMQVGKPEVIEKIIDGVVSEPFEEVTVEIDAAFVGVVTEELGKRHAELLDTITDERQIARMVYRISSRNLLGFRGDILTRTRGNGIFTSRILGYFPAVSRVEKLRNGVIISLENGKSSAYALTYVQERGKPLIGPGVAVYEGMIVGINNRSQDIEMNICKTKKLTNIHSATADVAIQLDQPVTMSLEQCLDFLEDDELLEITPENLRLRKRYLTHMERTRVRRQE